MPVGREWEEDNLDALLSSESATAAVLGSLAIVELCKAYGASSACSISYFLKKGWIFLLVKPW